MSHARIEEVSDSDPEIDDPEDFLPDSDLAPIRPVAQPSSSSSSSRPPQQQTQVPTNPSLLQQGPPTPSNISREDYEASRRAIKHFLMIYPCYFSSTRTRAQGRRVSKNLASPNPLAINILDALREIVRPETHQIRISFEADKQHPKDWSNPGRARVELFDRETGKSKHPHIHNKQHLFDEIAKYLKEHPAIEQDALKLRIPNLPVPEKFLETRTPKPRGWITMNDILPLHSCAVSGGGVKDDFFKEAMEEMRQMQAAGGGGAGGADVGGMAGLQQMMQSMGGMGGMGNLMGGGAGGQGGGEPSSGKKKSKKK